MRRGEKRDGHFGHLDKGLLGGGKDLTQRREGAKKTLVGFPYLRLRALA
jgi:hypothetical protein